MWHKSLINEQQRCCSTFTQTFTGSKAVISAITFWWSENIRADHSLSGSDTPVTHCVFFSEIYQIPSDLWEFGRRMVSSDSTMFEPLLCSFWGANCCFCKGSAVAMSAKTGDWWASTERPFHSHPGQCSLWKLEQKNVEKAVLQVISEVNSEVNAVVAYFI